LFDLIIHSSVIGSIPRRGKFGANDFSRCFFACHASESYQEWNRTQGIFLRLIYQVFVGKSFTGGGDSVILGGMAEAVEFAHRGAVSITSNILKGVHKKLPFLKLKFTELDNAAFPHLPDQLEFLADVVEDFAEGVEEDLPYATVASAVFALIYAQRQIDTVPDSASEFGHAELSAVVRAVLTEHEKVLLDYAQRHKMPWNDITFEP
jgi:uncharacterized membrane protein YkvA (DUF1232 family)